MLVNLLLTRLDHGMPRYLVNLWLYLWRCFWMGLTFKLIDRVKQVAFPNAGGPHPIRWRSEQNKMLTLTQERENSSCLTAFTLAHQLFPPLTNWNICSSWALLLVAFGLAELHHRFFWVSSLLTWHILGLVSSIIMWAKSL